MNDVNFVCTAYRFYIYISLQSKKFSFCPGQGTGGSFHFLKLNPKEVLIIYIINWRSYILYIHCLSYLLHNCIVRKHTCISRVPANTKKFQQIVRICFNRCYVVILTSNFDNLLNLFIRKSESLVRQGGLKNCGLRFLISTFMSRNTKVCSLMLVLVTRQ